MFNLNRIIHYINNPDAIKISKKWMNIILDCTPKGRKHCQGKCCTGHVDKNVKGKTFVQYTDKEVKKLPKSFKKYLTKDNIVKVDEKGNCKLIKLCLKYPKYKPIECKLSPLTIDEKGVLRIQYASICGACPNFKKGKLPIYITLKNDIIDLFGEEFYKRLENKMKLDNNSINKYTGDKK